MKVMVTMAKTIGRKKMTNSGGGVCLMTCIAALLALCSAADDYLPGLLYTQFFSRQVYDMSFNLEDFLYRNSSYISVAVFALVMMFWAFSAAKFKRMGKAFGWVNIFMSPVLCIYPALKLYDILGTDFFDKYFKTNYDSDKFVGAAALAKVGFPLIAGLLLILSGIVVLARVGGEDFVAEVPRGGKKEKAQPVSTDNNISVPENNEQESSAFGFGENTQSVQGLTGETKPATYNEAPVNTGTFYQPEAPAVDTSDMRPKRPSVKLCPKCGELVGDDELFCSNCGFRM